MFYLHSFFGLKSLQAQCELGIDFYNETSLTWFIFFFCLLN